MTGILNTAELLLQRPDTSLGVEGHLDVEHVKHDAARALDMVDGLMTLFQVIAAREARAWVDLETLVARVVSDLRRVLVQKHIHVTAQPLPRVWAHPQKLEHVFSNLLGNAVRYTPAGGEGIEVSATTHDGFVVVCVRDHGIGIPPPYRERIFKLFWRVPRQEQVVDGNDVGGAGVGLAMVRRIVEAHAGVVWCESESGGGSRFFVRLPVPSDNDVRPTPSVLVVDDDGAFLRGARAVLRRIDPDIEVHTAESGAAGLAFLGGRPPFVGAGLPQFIVLDFELPDMNAVAFLREMRSAEPTRDIPVLVVSQAYSQEREASSLGAGAEAFVVKPRSPELLRDHVEGFWREHVDVRRDSGRRG